jgi:hypothetical protein
MEPEKKPSAVVAGIENKPCGCILTNYSDGARTLNPCPPCGLLDVAQSLSRAAEALAAVSNRLRQEQSRAATAAMASIIRG